MQRPLLVLLSLLAGLDGWAFLTFCPSLPGLIGMVVFMAAWVLLRKRHSSWPLFNPYLYYLRAVFAVVCVVFVLGGNYLPPEIHAVLFYVFSTLFLILIIGFAYADYRDE